MITNISVPAALTPATDASPSPATKYRSTRKYSVWNTMPAAIGAAMARMFREIESWVRSFMYAS